VRKVVAKVVSVYAGPDQGSSKQQISSIDVDLVGVVGDPHRSYERQTWHGDKQAEGTTRRNERQWSAVSLEELAEISSEMDLSRALLADCLGANLCLTGVSQLSRLPKGTLLKFPSGAELMVEEYNPPCAYMGEKIASSYTTNSGSPISPTAFSKAAKLSRGIVGVVEAAGVINAGDEVSVEIYATPSWLIRSETA
jgi:MOSC domain-containing protein YiiM